MRGMDEDRSMNLRRCDSLGVGGDDSLNKISRTDYGKRGTVRCLFIVSDT